MAAKQPFACTPAEDCHTGGLAQRSSARRLTAVLLLALAFHLHLVGGSSEYEVKAAYVYNFTKFIEWPSPRLVSGLTICLCGKDSLAGFLDEAVRGKSTHGLPITIRRISPREGGWEECHVLFFGGDIRAAQVETMLKRLQGRSVLTIGESVGFAAKGGMLELFVDHDRVRFEVNVPAITAAQLRASSRLIELSRVAGGGK